MNVPAENDVFFIHRVHGKRQEKSVGNNERALKKTLAGETVIDILFGHWDSKKIWRFLRDLLFITLKLFLAEVNENYEQPNR